MSHDSSFHAEKPLLATHPVAGGDALSDQYLHDIQHAIDERYDNRAVRRRRMIAATLPTGSRDRPSRSDR